MPKAEKGSLKDIGKRIKAKGLQKLRFWCEMCSKQCRDANGFKCHLTSESHMRNMKLFSENANSIIRKKSAEFEKMFMDTLRLRHSTVMVNANNVYQEVIRDKSHVHMNSTHWATLSDFVQYLGKIGKCKVEETERGWYIQYRPVQSIEQQEQAKRKQQQAMADEKAEEAYQRRMEKLRVEQLAKMSSAPLEATNLDRDRGAPVKVTLTSTKKDGSTTAASTNKKPSVFGSDDEEDEGDHPEDGPIGPPDPGPSFIAPPQASNSKSHTSSKRSRDEVKHEIRLKKQRADTASSKANVEEEEEPWLLEGIQVRIIRKKSEYFKEKAYVRKILDPFTAQVCLLRDDSTRLEFDQRHLETVVPKEEGSRVYILRGRHRGEKAKLVSRDKHNFRAYLRVHGREMQYDFEEFSARA